MRRKILSLTLSLSLFFQYSGFAQTLNLANYLSQSPNPLVSTDRFRPIQLKYFSYEPETSDFKILLDKGDQKNLSDIQAEDEANKLLTYFKIGLTLPNEKFWVNLRPDAQDQIIDPELEKTDIGKILLEADLQLKKDTASWTSPQTKEGKEYWDKMYKRAGELLGSENVTIPTVTRPWIVPGEIILKASDSSAYIYKANLKVMLEEDYLKFSANPITQTDHSFSDPRLKELNQYSTQLIRDLIIPKLTKRINSSKDYVNLRQVYFSLILARWFKETFGNHQPPVSDRQPQDNSYINLINSHNLTDLNSKQSWDKTDYFKAYQKSFKQGEYRLSEPVYTPAGQVIRKYMSGGISVMGASGSPLEWGIFQGSGNLFKKLTDTFKNLVGINYREPDYLSEEDQYILNAALMNIFDASIVIEEIEEAISAIYEFDPDFAWDFPDRVKKFVRRFDENQDKVKFLNEKIKSALENKLSEEETGVLLTTLKTYYAALARQITSRFEESSYSAEGFSVFQILLEGPKFKNTPLGYGYTSADNKKEFIRKIIRLNTFDKMAETEKLSILSHAWREISGKTSHPGYITSKEAEKISDEYIKEMREYGNLIEDYVTRYPDYFNEEATSQIKGFLKINKIKEAAGIAAREIYLPYFHYAFHYDGWVTDYRRYVDLDTLIRAIKPSLDFSAELNDLLNEIKENLSKYPIFLKDAKIMPEKKGQDAWEAVEENLRAVDKGLHILKNTNSIFELFKELPDISEYLYARARTAKEETLFNKLKEEIMEFIYNNTEWFDIKEFEEYLAKGEPRDIMLTAVKIALVCAKKVGADSKEFHKWKNKARTLVKQFSTSSSTLEKGNAAVGSPLNLSGTGSSALTITENSETLGGIDLRQMNMLIQPQGEFSGLDLTLPVLSSSAIEAMDLDKELTNIQQMVSSGIIPSGQRLKEFLAACFAKGKIEEKADSLVLCIADTFELQQMEAEESSPIYKEALVIADTRRYVLKKG